MLQPAKTMGLTAMVCACLMLTAAAARADASASEDSQEDSQPSTPGPDLDLQPAAPTADRAWLAQLLLPTKVWSSEKAGRRMLFELQPTTEWGGTQQLLVLQTAQGRDGEGRWLKVRLNRRPNSLSGWIRDETAELNWTGFRIDVDRRSRTLKLSHLGREVRRFRVVVGSSRTPTPSGLFAIADKIKQSSPILFIGSWALPITAHSDVLRRFDGGDGQTAIHGRGGASLRDPLGTATSHGCVRMSNAAVSWLATRVPTGTPVQIR